MKKGTARLLAVGALAALPIVLLRSEAVRGVLAAFVGFLATGGVLGLATYAVAYLGGVALIAPLWLLSGIAGYAYGFARGLPIALGALTLAVCITFAAARFVARGLAPGEASGAAPRFWRAVALTAATDGLKLTLLLRLCAVMPQNLLTYLLAATQVRGRQFVAGTVLGLVPATLVHVYVGSLLPSAAALVAGENPTSGATRWALPALAGVAAVVTLLLTARLARRALDRTLAAAEAAAPPAA